MRAKTAWMRAVGGAAVAIACGAGGATAWGAKPGGGGGGSISTQGVVAFGVGVSDSTRGTYSMSPDGSGVLKLSGAIYPTDVSRGRTPATVLMNGDVSAQTDLVALRADGTSGPVTILSGSAGQARFSLDGNRIAFLRVDDKTVTPWVRSICVADAVRNGSGDVTGVANVAAVHTTTNQVSGLDFSRDGSKIVFSALGDLWTVRISDGATSQLTSTTQVEQNPRWSPADDRIAFDRRDTSGSAVASILTLDAGTGAVKTVVAGGTGFYASWPVWSPDATTLLVLGSGRNKPIDLYQVPSAGGTAVNVTTAAGLQENTPAWGW